MPVSKQGYVRPTYDEILEERIALAKELFGEEIDTSDASALGKFIRLAVQDLADAYEAQEIIYYSRFPHTATGQNLDRLMPFAGISRNPATRAEHQIKFTGTAGYTIPVGFLVGTTGDEEFYLVNAVTIGADGTGIGIVQCTELGTFGNVAIGEITEIVNPDADVESIQHIAVETIAVDEESDADLRSRFELAVEGSGSYTSTSIRGAIMRINGVTGCLVVENKENTTDSDGRPPHSFEVFVYAPSTLDQQIAETIFSKKPLGIKTFGDVSVNVKDDSGETQVIKFSRVSETAVYINVTVNVNSDFEVDGVEQIKNALSAYVNGLATGDDVVYASLYKYIFGVAGVTDVTALGLSTDGTSYSSQNISIDESHVARINTANVKVTVNENA